ncbi:MAG: alpha/beta hydrolase [Pisciglobus halotolerans]|nr:alpha/beta hydrolase [Pisciglobus halotolerans]
MEYIYKESKKDAPVFVLLHGTGGSETDLVSLAEFLNKDYTILGIRGNVQENGMNRYFKRHGEGQYDWEDLEFRGSELYTFILEKSKKYSFEMKDVVLVGFSNGSNIAINMMIQQPDTFKKAALFAPMYPTDLDEKEIFTETKVFLSLGKNDPIVPETESKRVINLFEQRGAEVTTFWVNGHNLSQEAALEAKKWLNQSL